MSTLLLNSGTEGWKKDAHVARKFKKWIAFGKNSSRARNTVSIHSLCPAVQIPTPPIRNSKEGSKGTKRKTTGFENRRRQRRSLISILGFGEVKVARLSKSFEFAKCTVSDQETRSEYCL